MHFNNHWIIYELKTSTWSVGVVDGVFNTNVSISLGLIAPQSDMGNLLRHSFITMFRSSITCGTSCFSTHWNSFSWGAKTLTMISRTAYLHFQKLFIWAVLTESTISNRWQIKFCALNTRVYNKQVLQVSIGIMKDNFISDNTKN